MMWPSHQCRMELQELTNDAGTCCFRPMSVIKNNSLRAKNKIVYFVRLHFGAIIQFHLQHLLVIEHIFCDQFSNRWHTIARAVPRILIAGSYTKSITSMNLNSALLSLMFGIREKEMHVLVNRFQSIKRKCEARKTSLAWKNGCRCEKTIEIWEENCVQYE